MRVFKNIFCAALITLMSGIQNNASAQLFSEASIGVMGGLTMYYGDLPTKANAGLAINLSKENIYKKFSARFQLSYGDMKSSMIDSFGRTFVKFTAQFLEASVLSDYNFFDVRDKMITPYITAGIGVAGYFNKLSYYKGNYLPQSKLTVNIPFGAGFKYAYNNDINFRLEYLQRVTFSNKIDGIDFSKGYDYIGQIMFGMDVKLAAILPYRKDWKGRLE